MTHPSWTGLLSLTLASTRSQCTLSTRANHSCCVCYGCFGVTFCIIQIHSNTETKTTTSSRLRKSLEFPASPCFLRVLWLLTAPVPGSHSRWAVTHQLHGFLLMAKGWPASCMLIYFLLLSETTLSFGMWTCTHSSRTDKPPLTFN